MKKKMIPILAAILLIILVAVIGIVSSVIKKYTPTDERADVNEYYNLTQDDQVALILEDKLLEAKGKVFDGVPYIAYETVTDYLNERFYWDSKENVLIYTTPDDVISVGVGSKEYSISKNMSSVNYVILKVDGDVAYIAAEFVQQYTNMDYEFLEKPNRIIINNEWGQALYTTVKKEDSVRVLGGIKSPILSDVVKGDKLTVLEELGEWTKVRTSDGYIGYIQASKLSNTLEETVAREFVEPVYTSISEPHKINLVWHQVTSQDANNQLQTMLSTTKGVNTISPTWFSLVNNQGELSSLADNNYVNVAHEAGIDVWGLVDNFSDEVDTLEVLSYTSKREALVNQLVAYAIQYQLDGINIDFEEIQENCGDAYIQFIRELSIKCRKNDIVLSIDNPVPMPYTAHYNRKEQGIVADYVIIMGYDEHYSTSTESGSVASLPFVRAGIIETLLEVPAEKVINGIPFYTRIWKETTDIDDNVVVSSEAVGMSYAEQFIANCGMDTHWSEDTSQYYGELQMADGFYRIWLEEEESIEEKMKLIRENNLAGVAAWKLGLEKQSVWDVILKYVN